MQNQREPELIGGPLQTLFKQILEHRAKMTPQKSSATLIEEIGNGWRRKPPAEFQDLEERADWPKLRSDLNQQLWPVYLHGTVGTGKSYSAALAYCRFPGSAKFMTWCDFANDAAELAKSKEITRWIGEIAVEISAVSFWRVIETIGLLVIDEIGTGSMVGWRKEDRNELLWKVLGLRAGKPFILTGNIEPLELERYFDPRIYSRICKGQMIQRLGADQRKRGLKDRVK